MQLGGKIYHLYGRRHGDLERDYNAFHLPAEFYSQGNAAYRDVNQNRRCDVLLNPGRGRHGGAGPPGADPGRRLQPAGSCSAAASWFRRSARRRVLDLVDRPEALRPLLAGPFTPGQLLKAVLDARAAPVRARRSASSKPCSAQAEQDFGAAFGEGYWIDHWYYNLDLIQSYLAVYPDRQDELLFERTVPYYESPAFVRPRDRKYVLTGEGVRQYEAVERDEEHAALIAARAEWPNLARTGTARARYSARPCSASCCELALIKFATLDPLGMGMEMEAGKPGWCDALNGLPGLFGSSMPATYELLRLARLPAGRPGEQDRRRSSLPVEIGRTAASKVAEALAAYRCCVRCRPGLPLLGRRGDGARGLS